METTQTKIKLMFIFWTVVTLICYAITANSQNIVKRNENGMYVSVKNPKDTVKDKLTGDYYYQKGVKYPIYVSKNGKFYCLHISKKTGKEYRHYLKLQ